LRGAIRSSPDGTARIIERVELESRPITAPILLALLGLLLLPQWQWGLALLVIAVVVLVRDRMTNDVVSPSNSTEAKFLIDSLEALIEPCEPSPRARELRKAQG
jgi:hypothetical protein